MFSLKGYDIPIDLIIHCILKFVSYFELDHILPCFKLSAKEIANIKFKIYKQRLKVTKQRHNIEYTVDGNRHREDGPALIRTNGDKEWHLNGALHRDNDLPAIEDATGYKAWFINGKRHNPIGPAIIYHYGRKEWFLNGELHRADGPAIEWNDSPKKWFINGQQVPEF